MDGFLTAKYEHAGLPNQAVTQYEYSSRGELLLLGDLPNEPPGKKP